MNIRNIRNILTGTIALATLTTTVKADVEVRITGATAFRTAAINALKAQFDIGNNGVSYAYAHNKAAGSVNAADRVTFKGKFPGVAGTTTVRVSHNGSVEGLRAIAVPNTTNNPFFITDAALSAPSGSGAETGGVSGTTAQQVAKFSYTDVLQSSTPVTGALGPADPKIGVTLFTMIANDGAPAGLTNVSFQQFKALFSGGSIPLSVFTGVAADTAKVYATGRNDGSGTRTAYLAESQLGISTLVSQFVATSPGSGTAGAVSVIQKVPAGGATINGTFDPTSASTLWGQDLDGNGGYFSGSALRDVLGRTTASTVVRDADGSTLEAASQIHLVTWISTADAVPARQAGAKILGWNGSILDSLNTGTTVSATDLAKITEGQYTAWTFQNLYYTGTLSADEDTVYTAIKTGIPASLVAAGYVPGVPDTIMNVGRSDDGAPVTP